MAFYDRWDNIAYLWTNGILKTLPESFVDHVSPANSVKKLKLTFKHFGADFLRMWRSEDIPKNKIWFLVLTKNNYDALKDVEELTNDSIFVSFFRYRSTINKETFYFNLGRKFLWDLLYPFFWGVYAIKRPKKAIRYFDLFMAVNGSFWEFKRTIKKYRPRAIVFTNDHLVEARSMLLAANSLDVPTFYIPHASVSEYFPPLEFTYSLLDGQDALDKYRKCGPINSNVELLGMPKFDKYVGEVNVANTVKSVGIAYNMVDKVEDVLKLAKLIKANISEVELILRPHPGDTRSFEKEIEEITLSDSKKEDAFSFLKKIDVLISGESSIHLEAVLLNVYPLYYSFSPNNRYDYYGYIKKGLVEPFANPQKIVQELNELKTNRPDIRSRANYYNAAVNASFYGKSCEVMSELITQKAN
tara:strand:- start:8471 stop:9715 length:1245 start_codon:yes stop_codon:yes gene_type:complete